jgi:hypothetical protein
MQFQNTSLSGSNQQRLMCSLTALPFLQADVSSVMLLSGFTNCQSSCSNGVTQVSVWCCADCLVRMHGYGTVSGTPIATLAAVHA